MKKILLILVSVLLCAITFAQNVPQGINYQAIARDTVGAELTNNILIVQFSLISDTSSSAVSWQETHSVTTNDYGLFSAIIGQGTSTNGDTSATFDVVDWGASNHFLQVEIDYGSGYVDMGTTAFMSVPYSMYTKTASNVDSTDELQYLSISGDTIFISSGNYIVLPTPALLGCTDSLYTEYYASANTDDGSCATLIVNGCMDNTAFNYDALANTDNGSCIAVVNGCMDNTAFNYDTLANTDDGSCIAVVNGCTNPLAFNYDITANTADGSCVAVVNGCTDSTAYSGYDPLANTDDGSCIAVVNGCNDPLYTEYDPLANTNDGSCATLIVNGCTDSTATNYNPLANTDDGSCVAVVNGCTDSIAFNYDANANTNDSSCIAVALGCTDATAFNYNTSANTDDSSCVAVINGCTDVAAFNYNASANIDDSSCVILGCTDILACNYDSSANTNNSSCTYAAANEDCSGACDSSFVQDANGNCIGIVYGCTDFNFFNYSPIANTDDGSCVPVVLGCIDTVATNYNSNSNVNDGSCLINGCTDFIACNYNANATVDNGLCTFSTTEIDCAGNCLNGGENTYISVQRLSNLWGTESTTAGAGNWTLTELASGNVVYSGYDDEVTFTCLTSCYEISTSSGFQEYQAFAYQIGPDAANLGALIVPGDFGASATDILGSGCISGCTDATALNYDPSADIDDGSCMPHVYGCLDVLACNYDATVTTSYAGSCTYAAVGFDCNGNCLGSVSVVYTKSSGAATWYGNVFTISTCDSTLVSSGGINIYNNNSGIYDDFNTCIDLGDNYTITWSDSYANDISSTGYGWYGGNLSINGVAINIPNGGSGSIQVGDACPVYGCTDNTMGNYDPLADIDDGSCLSQLNGCIDSDAENYNPLVTHDDGSCTFQMTYVPDYWFEAYLEGQGWGDGISNNDSVRTTFISTVETLQIGYQNIGDLTGIEDFTDLTYLDCSNNANYNGPLSTLNLSNNTALTYLNCSDNTITSLDLSNNIYLQHLECYNNNITSLDLSSNTFLTKLYCFNNQLIWLDIKNGNNINITNFSSSSNPQLICINVDDPIFSTANWTDVDPISIFDMWCIAVNGCLDVVANNYDSLANTDDGSCIYSYTFIPDDNFEQALINLGYDNILDDSVNTLVIQAITTLDISGNNINDLTGIEDFISLTELECEQNNLTSLNLSNNTALTILKCWNNNLTSLDLSGNTDLTTLWCFYNQLTSLDLSGANALTVMRCDDNQLTSLGLKNGNNTNITSFGALNNPNLTCISVDNAVWSTANWSSMIDITSYFSDNCQNGCTDPLAANFRAEATVDDGSCTYCSSTPYCENFDAGIGGWTNNGWTLGGWGTGTIGSGGSTPSANTGPSDDITGGGKYMYMEVVPFWFPEYTPTISMTSECFQITDLTSPTLSFKYHMYGVTMGTLDVLVNGTNVWSLSGNQGNQWEFVQIDLSAFAGSSNLTVEFLGTVGTSSTSDMAIDEVCVDEYLVIPGCTDPTACNYVHMLFANQDDGSCTGLWGCMDQITDNYNPAATCDDGSCGFYGCLDNSNISYNPDATIHQIDSCTPCANMFGCIDVFQCTYDPNANCSDFSCEGYDYDEVGCMDPIACNYNADATCSSNLGPSENYLCIFYGCTNPAACNYDPLAGCDDGSCLLVFGCTDVLACNYDQLAVCDDGSCLTQYGCTDPSACNYVVGNQCDDGSCTYWGCTDTVSPNYDANATCDDGTCLGIGDFYDGGVIFYLDGNGGGLIAAISNQNQGTFNYWENENTNECGCTFRLDGGGNWGCSGTHIQAMSGNAIGTGYANTQAILSNCTNKNAAIMCDSFTTYNYALQSQVPGYFDYRDCSYGYGSIVGTIFGGTYGYCVSVGGVLVPAPQPITSFSPSTGWYLPSQQELVEMYNQRAVITTTSISNGGKGFTHPNNGGANAIFPVWGSYWSSSQKDADNAWSVDFENGNVEEKYKGGFAKIRAIRAF